MKKDCSVRFQQSALLPWIELKNANQSSACFEAHSHDEFSFGIIERGQAVYRNRQCIHQIGQGDLVTINPADVHSCNPELGAWSYRMLFVDAIKMGEMQQDILGNNRYDYTPFECHLEQQSELKHKFTILFNTLQYGTSIQEAQEYLYDFIAASLKKHAHHPTQQHHLRADLSRVREQLLDETSHNYPLDELAHNAGMSRYQLIRAFKHQFGLPPYAYLIDEKIKRAKIMLKSGQKISDVALQLGFADQAHFQRQFKRKLTVTPKFYQSHFI